jgi:hypothetical protein
MKIPNNPIKSNLIKNLNSLKINLKHQKIKNQELTVKPPK